jgi:predicted ATP-grasp superfamily ATP-dependent carboligase
VGTGRIVASPPNIQDTSSSAPEERDIAALNDPEIIENKVVEIYNRIDDFSEENKIKLALALKTYWEDHEKWEKKRQKELLNRWIEFKKLKTYWMK